MTAVGLGVLTAATGAGGVTATGTDDARLGAGARGVTGVVPSAVYAATGADAATVADLAADAAAAAPFVAVPAGAAPAGAAPSLARSLMFLLTSAVRAAASLLA